MIVWKTPPTDLAVDAYIDRLEQAATRAANRFAAYLEQQAKADAPWTDQTGNARRGLFAAVARETQAMLTIYLSHGPDVDYGIYLETKNGERFAVIMPTIQMHGRKLWDFLKEELD